MDNPSFDVLRVLIVDDNRDAADSLASVLELHRYAVRIAYDGLGGLRLAREFGPDCVITDINMPGLDGYELARRLRACPELAQTKLVVLSGYSDDEHIRKVQDAGFDYRLTKGCEADELLEVLMMIEEIKALATQTQELARQNVELAGQTKELIQEVKEDVKEVKQEVKEVKKEVKQLKQEVQELKAEQKEPKTGENPSQQ